jgi:ABC-type uncharacterized transport system involved in gliding motility auxiliary subunit
VKRDLRPLALPAYAIGLGALVIAGLLYLFQRQVDTPLRIALVLGALGISSGVVLDPERVRRVWSTRQARYGSNSLLVSLSALGIIVVAYSVLSSLDLRWDLSEGQQNSLAPESQLLLGGLDEDVALKGFYSAESAGARDSLRPLLEEYRARSRGRVTYQFIDPNENPLEADSLGVTRDATLVVVVQGRSEVLAFPSEREITSAILRLSFPEERKVYFLTGHGEADLEGSDDSGLSQTLQALQSKNYSVDALNLIANPEVPQDALAIVVVGPRQSPTEEEIALLQSFLEQGGGLVLLLQPSVESEIDPAQDGLARALEDGWGIRLEDNVVVDLRSRIPILAVAFQYGDHPITQRMQNTVSSFPVARSLSLLPVASPDRNVESLVLTSSESWGESRLEELRSQETAEFNDGEDQPGPVTLAAVADDTASGARLVVFGDSDFATNASYFSFGNGDILLNSVDWAAGQDELISLTPKDVTQRVVIPPTQQLLTSLWFVTLVLMPGGVLALGGWMWWSRRRRG